MTPFPLNPIEEANFSATGHFRDSRLALRLWGSAEAPAKEHLDVFLDAADRQSLAAGIKEVVVDFRELVFMTSLCLKALVTWLVHVQERPADQRYAIRFLMEPTAHWQTRSFAALVAIGNGVLTVE